jgi:hypothetical protein
MRCAIEVRVMLPNVGRNVERNVERNVDRNVDRNNEMILI